jgi:hypothetical protein
MPHPPLDCQQTTLCAAGAAPWRFGGRFTDDYERPCGKNGKIVEKICQMARLLVRGIPIPQAGEVDDVGVQ